MNRYTVAATAILLAASATNASAWSQETHKRIAIDAVNYMRAHPTTTNYAKLAAAATKAGYSVDQMAAVIGQGAYDVDDFADTYICGATTGNCQLAPVWGYASSIAKYTSWWHFQNHTRGADAHGNDLGGYNYHLLTVWGSLDSMAATWLVGDYLDDGAGGMGGWFGDSSKYNTYGITEANYRQGGTSTKSMYGDFETMPFQPIDNLGQYWYTKFRAAPTFQTLGFVLHTTDLLQPHHTWTTIDLNHSGFESWVNDNYYTLGLNSDALTTTALNDFTALPVGATEIRGLLTRGGDISYAQGGSVLSSTDSTERTRVAKIMIPHSIAMCVRLLNEAANRF